MRAVLTPEHKQKIAELHGIDPIKWSRKVLAERYRCSLSAIHYIVNPGARSRKRNQSSQLAAIARREREYREASAGKRAAGVSATNPHRERIERDAREHLKKIPEDTRTYTQRFFGDPLPGRSALDRRAGG